ncbi:MAG TPA: sigma-70 family RNA polymerase sigma factor [Gammaproteobacteria bacterium]|nr:sigma-70 family RNA polymerase sigma factor [Gammaproteobacteria bacterium]
MTSDDQVLIDRVNRNGDQHAFAELVKRYQSQLRYSLRQLVGQDAALADDLAQETFIRVYKSLHQFEGNSRFFTWIYRIAYNCFAAYCRSRKEELPLDDDLADNLPDPNPGPGADIHLDMARALQNFPPEQRMALHLFYQREFTHNEIALVMDRPLGTVKSYITRGQDKLRLLMQSWQAEAER